MKLCGFISVGVNVRDRLLVDFLHSADTGEKWERNKTVRQIFIDFKKFCDSVRMEVSYNILIVWGTHETYR
jgi:hypothetical protein